ncbi:hypothetical protein PRK78_000361 [Emydomyces testavorans]|uniref:Uncharacterized protein n=1 Tax=Emydomyces testavorans TaxID=2070801 RepID=A0AAF0DB99_9EURO|nr:hypothetical protein PRK78_000361 [Emydomyces testavorans]
MEMCGFIPNINSVLRRQQLLPSAEKRSRTTEKRSGLSGAVESAETTKEMKGREKGERKKDLAGAVRKYGVPPMPAMPAPTDRIKRLLHLHGAIFHLRKMGRAASDLEVELREL